MRRVTEERGFTIVEIMVAVVILLTGALGTLAMLDMATQRTRTADDRQKATSLAREVVEAAKGIPYRRVSPSALVAQLREDDTIAGSSGSPWRVEREGTTYTIDANVCWVDEPADGYGARTSGPFCDGSGAGGTSDSNPVDFKRVSVEVSWNTPAGRGKVRQSTLITVRGGADAPAVQNVRLTSPLSSPITDPGVQSAAFAVTTVADATSVIWLVDGTQHGTAYGSGRNWTFQWQLPDADATYLVAAQTIEGSGLLGEAKSVTVVVNRHLPRAPEKFTAGRNGDLVEAKWDASRDRDVVGYRVYRQSTTGQPVVVCEFTEETSCVDAAAPAAAGGVLEYWAVAIEEAAGVQREGDPSTRVDVNSLNRAPNPPEALALSKDAQGNTVLTWKAAAVPDPDTGDTVASYRIYRDGTALANRHITVAGTETTATDTETGGRPHQYWVVAVDSRLAESTPLGPVSG